MNARVAVVTGGAGFIGSHAVDCLIARGYSVRVVDDLRGGRVANLENASAAGNVMLYEQDICELEPDSAIFTGADIVLHFAGIGDIVPSVERPTDYMNTNVLGTVRVLEASRTAGVRRLVYAASSSCYGASPPTPTSEQAPIVTEYPYALSKFLGEQAAFHWMHVYGLSVNSVRIFNAYGTRSRTSGAYGAVFGVFLKQKLVNAPFTVVGDGTQARDFVYVTDVAEVFVRAAETHLAGHVWNLGCSNPQAINRLVELLDGPVVRLPKRPGEPDVTWADTTAVQRDLQWVPQISFEEGVARVLADIEYWAEAPLWDEVSIATATAAWFAMLSSSADDPL